MFIYIYVYINVYIYVLVNICQPLHVNSFCVSFICTGNCV